MNNPFDDLKGQLDRIESLLSNTSLGYTPERIIEQPITTDELCAFLRISEPTLIRLKKKSKIPFLEIGGSIRFDKAAVLKALEKKDKAVR